jgi:hypothetical protein
VVGWGAQMHPPIHMHYLISIKRQMYTTLEKRQIDDESLEIENLIKRVISWLGEEICVKDTHTRNTTIPGLSLVQWMKMNKQQSSTLATWGYSLSTYNL